MDAEKRIIVAYDSSDFGRFLACAEEFGSRVGFLKIRFSLAAQTGLQPVVSHAKKHDARIVYDPKFADIPNSMAEDVSAAVGCGVDMLTIHTSCGKDSIRAAVKNRGTAKILGVTVLTSIDTDECVSIFGVQARYMVPKFAETLRDAGADGIVCSPQEVRLIRDRNEFDGMLVVTPGVRPEWAATNDQKRVMTPGEAIAVGADYLVIGRPILKPPPEIGTPLNAIERIAEEIRLARPKP